MVVVREFGSGVALGAEVKHDQDAKDNEETDNSACHGLTISRLSRPGWGNASHMEVRTYPIAAMSPILESVDMDGFSQVLTCAVSTQSFRRVKIERAILPPRLRRLFEFEVEAVMAVSIAARAAGDRMSRECNLSMMASCIASCCFQGGSSTGAKERVCRGCGSRVAGGLKVV